MKIIAIYAFLLLTLVACSTPDYINLDKACAESINQSHLQDQPCKEACDQGVASSCERLSAIYGLQNRVPEGRKISLRGCKLQGHRTNEYCSMLHDFDTAFPPTQ